MDNPLVQPEPGLFIWTIVTFLVLLWILARYAWRPLLDALENRQEMIRKSLDDARQAKQDLERVQQDSAKIVSEARTEAGAIVANSRADAAKLRDELRQKARAEADAILKNAEKRIQQETARALFTDSTGGGRCFAADRLEADSAQSVQSGQRSIDRRYPQADPHATGLGLVTRRNGVLLRRGRSR